MDNTQGSRSNHKAKKLVLDLETKETTVGLSYVAFSRATKLSDIGINGGCSRERLKEEIAKKQYLKRRKKADAKLTKLTEKTKEKLLEHRHKYQID